MTAEALGSRKPRNTQVRPSSASAILERRRIYLGTNLPPNASLSPRKAVSGTASPKRPSSAVHASRTKVPLSVPLPTFSKHIRQESNHVLHAAQRPKFHRSATTSNLDRLKELLDEFSFSIIKVPDEEERPLQPKVLMETSLVMVTRSKQGVVTVNLGQLTPWQVKGKDASLSPSSRIRKLPGLRSRQLRRENKLEVDAHTAASQIAIETRRMSETTWAEVTLSSLPRTPGSSPLSKPRFAEFCSDPNKDSFDEALQQCEEPSPRETDSVLVDDVENRRASVLQDEDEGTEYAELLADLLRNKTFDGFSEEEQLRMTNAFKHFKVTGSSDIHKDRLLEFLDYLGYVGLECEDVGRIYRDFTMQDYISFEEVQSFMIRFFEHYRLRHQDAFNACCAEGSVRIATSHARQLMLSLGYHPSRTFLDEAVELLDEDKLQEVDFDSFMLLVNIYQRMEGFSKKEVASLRKTFDALAGTPTGSKTASSSPTGGLLPNAFREWFGLEVGDTAKMVVRQIISDEEPASFQDFLVFARRIKEDQMQKLLVTWNNIASCAELLPEDKPQKHFAPCPVIIGHISLVQLEVFLLSLRYACEMKAIAEICEEVTKTQCRGNLDFNDFADIVLLYRQRSGFSKQAVYRYQTIFKRFDPRHSGLKSFNLQKIFKEEGYKVHSDELPKLMINVYQDEPGVLTFMQFLHLMSLHRRKELQRIKEVYKDLAPEGCLPAGLVGIAIRRLGYEEHAVAQSHNLDFEEFVSRIDECRHSALVRERINAGFPQEKIDSIREMFKKFDKDCSNTIDPTELIQLLKLPSFQYSPETKKEQAELVKMISLARKKAKEAGAPIDGPDSSMKISFWVLVQLVKLFDLKREKAEEEKFQLLLQEVKFSKPEADQFLDIFVHWSQINEEKRQPKGQERMTIDQLLRMLRSIGLSVFGHLFEDLMSGLKPFLDDDNKLDYINFLKATRWMLDNDFAGLRSVQPKSR